MLLSPVVVVVCVLLFFIYFPEELGFIKNIEKERKKDRKKEREKKIRNCNPLLLLLLLSINNSVSSFAGQFCVDSADEQTEIFEFQSVCS
jgi:hypothetical protein